MKKKTFIQCFDRNSYERYSPNTPVKDTLRIKQNEGRARNKKMKQRKSKN